MKDILGIDFMRLVGLTRSGGKTETGKWKLLLGQWCGGFPVTEMRSLEGGGPVCKLKETGLFLTCVGDSYIGHGQIGHL